MLAHMYVITKYPFLTCRTLDLQICFQPKIQQ